MVKDVFVFPLGHLIVTIRTYHCIYVFEHRNLLDVKK